MQLAVGVADWLVVLEAPLVALGVFVPVGVAEGVKELVVVLVEVIVPEDVTVAVIVGVILDESVAPDDSEALDVPVIVRDW